MSEVITSSDNLPIFLCANCGDRSGLTTDDYQLFTCPICGWTLEMI